jgi:apolipoprotein N-acyltransferase
MEFLLPILTGLLLTASFPRADQGYLAWVAFIPLAAFVFRVPGTKGAFGGGFIAGFLEFFLLLVWMPAVLAHYGGLSPALAWFAYALLIGVLACYPAAACALAKFVHKRCGEASILFFPAIWIIFEYAASFSPFRGLPWLLAGYSQSRFLTIIQVADITGVYGISFLLVWTAAAVVLFLKRRGRGFLAWVPVVAACALMAGCLLYGKVQLRRWGQLDPRYSAALLQGNISFDEPERIVRVKFLDGYVRMATGLGPGQTDLLLLPESPSPLNFELDLQYRQEIQALARRFPLGIVFNNIRYQERQENNGQYFNSAYFLDRNGKVTGIYDKVHLVPFGEYIPLKNVFSFIETISKDVSAFDPGSGYPLIDIGGRPSNAVICFEAVFPDLVRRFVDKGSRLVINLTNDGWYGDSAAPYQHLAIVRLRAVENRRYLLRAANSGVSAIIDPTGRIQSSTGILREAICEGRFDFLETRTWYTRYGDVFVFLCAIISCGSALWAGLSGVIHKRCT